MLFIVTLGALLGTSALFVLSASQEPPQVAVGDIDGEYLDTVVKTQGYVMDRRLFHGTFHVSIREPEDEHKITVLINSDVMEDVDGKEYMIPGAIVYFQGRVEQYGRQYRMRVSNPGDMRMVERARSSFTPIESILENPTWYEGTNVRVRGEVKDLWTISRGTHIVICPLDNPYRRLSCEVDGWHVDRDMAKGDHIVIDGFFEYSQYKGMWVLRSEGRPEIH